MAVLAEDIDSREQVTERAPNGERRIKSITLHLSLEHTADEADAREIVEDNTEPTWAEDELVRTDIRIDPLVVDTVTDTGTWEVEVDYVRLDVAEPETGDDSYSFDTTGGTQHLTQSLETRGGWSAGIADAPEHKGAIGVRKDSVEGVDVTIPVFRWSETHYLSVEDVTGAYKVLLFRLTGKTNAAPFKGLAIGEALFLGASGAQRGNEDWEIRFDFAASENRTDIVIGDITVPTKKGWDYLWVLYENAEDAESKRLVPQPLAAYVEKVYEEGDLSGLGIGG